MRLPNVKYAFSTWNLPYNKEWTELTVKASEIAGEAGKNDAFGEMLNQLRNMARTGSFGDLLGMLKRRLTARALSWFWLSDDIYAQRLLNPKLLLALTQAQQPRLTRITLQQLLQLYFRKFDLLDQHNGFRAALEQVLLEQLEKVPEPRIRSLRPNPLTSLKVAGNKLLSLDGPRRLSEDTRASGRELNSIFAELGLQGLDDGRYADICRAHFYLDTLKNLPFDEWSPVMDELLKHSVNKVPFEGNRCIGHAALEILIDRVAQEPSEAWQNFVINLAGDPRIASSSENYRQWWLPLGESRIQKVRGWLSKEDLRLFLKAVEQYGKLTNNFELMRMFPARKTFLEGLFKLKLIRNTRLLLGNSAQQIVKDILGNEVKTSFAHMDGVMNEKAVIYLDCGDFFLIEGSHSFKFWVYLAPPSDSLTSYEVNRFSHHELTIKIPSLYKRNYNNLPSASIVHTPNSWQNKVFNFLAENGIGLDIEQLLNPDDYQNQLRRFGLPAIAHNRIHVVPTIPTKTAVMQPQQSTPTPIRLSHDQRSLSVQQSPARIEPSNKIKENETAKFPSLSQRDARKLPNDVLAKLQKKYQTSSVSNEDKPKSQSANVDALTSQSGNVKDIYIQISKLGAFERRVLKYFASNEGDKARAAANVMGVSVKGINHLLYGPLKKLCVQDNQFGWHVKQIVIRALTDIDKS